MVVFVVVILHFGKPLPEGPVSGVFSTREDAEAYADNFTDRDYEVFVAECFVQEPVKA